MKLYWLLLPLLTWPLLASATPYLAQGCLIGEVTQTSALMQTRLTALPGPALDDAGDLPGAAGFVRFEYSTHPDLHAATQTAPLSASAESDFIVRAYLTDLQPDQTYFYRAIFGTDLDSKPQLSPIASFKTLPSTDSTTPVSFLMGSCQNYAFFMHGPKGNGSKASAEDRQLGFPAYAAMHHLKPHFFIGTGDIVYYDHPAKTAAKTLPDLRKKWHETFRFPRLIDFFASTPAFWSKDDHDFRFNDADLAGSKPPTPGTGIQIFREQMPVHPAGDHTTPSYRTHRINRHLQLWFTEGRDHRSPNKMTDGPKKTLWGTAQREWLMRTLQQSDATFKILITPTPMVGPDDASKTDNHVNLGGFRHEADQFFEWIRSQQIQHFYTFCGDRHWQYHSVHPSGVEEFACGALNDENSRRGVPPGSPKGTDPTGLIRQLYTYPEPTGGFLHVHLTATAQLQIDFLDDQGLRLHRVIKSASP
jgi:alkaline phosphatase/alkaline phosphatase D